jgi:hypothetical protein
MIAPFEFVLDPRLDLEDSAISISNPTDSVNLSQSDIFVIFNTSGDIPHKTILIPAEATRFKWFSDDYSGDRLYIQGGADIIDLSSFMNDLDDIEVVALYDKDSLFVSRDSIKAKYVEYSVNTVLSAIKGNLKYRISSNDLIGCPKIQLKADLLTTVSNYNE